ncbi:YbjQ family protein [Peptoniphilus catoniae]|uniref:YbjQ family protein n=1 Tax=Peptoniphilus catoniae TaxID=1660341 RepID=UPI0010FE49EB|nr:YbjQ family protein [Peptoniphilus catoniae]
MILATTNVIEGREVSEYLGLVFGEAVNGINIIKDIGAGFRNIVGGRSSGYENEMIESRNDCINEMITRAKNMGADAVIGIHFDFQSLGQGNMLLLNVSGTAVKLK